MGEIWSWAGLSCQVHCLSGYLRYFWCKEVYRICPCHFWDLWWVQKRIKNLRGQQNLRGIRWLECVSWVASAVLQSEESWGTKPLNLQVCVDSSVGMEYNCDSQQVSESRSWKIIQRLPEVSLIPDSSVPDLNTIVGWLASRCWRNTFWKITRRVTWGLQLFIFGKNATEVVIVL